MRQKTILMWCCFYIISLLFAKY